jgi:hypothetical protein
VRKGTRQSVRFEHGFAKPIDAVFDGETQSSDGGLLMLRAVDEQLGLTTALAACLDDRREQTKVAHDYLTVLRQRVFAIAGGYPDGNDAARVGADPIFKEVCGRRALSGDDLASQPTLSRFENAASAREVVQMGRALEDHVLSQHQRRLKGKAKVITIDLDPTEDRTYGDQQSSLFNGFYESWCYLPQLGFLAFDDEAEQHLFHARLRPGTASGWRGVPHLLRRTVPKLRAAFPGVEIRVRLDSGFASPRVYDALERLKVKYVVSMPSNSRLKEFAEPLLVQARAAAAKSGKSAEVFGECSYAAREGWPHERRVVIKGEVVVHPGREPKDNARFVVTNMRLVPRSIYSRYCERADVENRIKELNLGLALGRTSCTRFVANQLRVLMTAAAYVLFQELRRAAKGTSLAKAQVFTLRERLLKVGARVVESVRRLVLHLPAACPWADDWLKVARVVRLT